MKPYVITISRQFASLGRYVAQRLAKQLGIKFYDRDIVEETAKRLGLPISDISKLEEGSGESYAYMLFPLGRGNKKLQDEVFMTQSNIIRDLAKKESCIIVGRCGDAVLKNHPRMLSAHIYAPKEQRFKNCLSELEMDEKTARKMIEAVDVSRERFRREYGQRGSLSEHTNLMIDSSRFGIDGSAEILARTAEMMFFDEK